MTSPLHVLIIGGGLAGPTLALSLARHHIRSTIYELRTEYADAGGSISIGPNALRILDKYAGVYERIKAEGYSYRRMGAYFEDGEKLGEIVAVKDDDPYQALRIMRPILHKSLLDAAEQQGVEVKWGMKVESLVEDEHGVTAYFADGTKARGDILIGCDGVHSKVRQHVLGASAPTPAFDGVAVVNGFLPASKAILPTPGFTFPTFTFSPDGMLMTIPIDAKGETLAWGINMSVKEHNRETFREMEMSGEAARTAKAGYADIAVQPTRSVLDNADESSARMWAGYGIPAIKTWHTAKICLIGDAAHALPPNGQGSGLAFEDAALLTRLLTATNDVEKAFARLEAIRRPRIEEVRGSSATAGVTKKRTGPWVWFLKKWAMRAYFWWNGGALQFHTKMAYDVDKEDLGL